MKRLTILLSALLLAACQNAIDPSYKSARDASRAAEQRVPAFRKPPPAPPAERHVRYHRSEWSGDTLRVTAPTPDKGLVMRYVYVRSRLRWIDVFDYAGENETNVLDFEPKFYQILVDGRIDVPDDFCLM